jgi:hypothetical protein
MPTVAQHIYNKYICGQAREKFLRSAWKERENIPLLLYHITFLFSISFLYNLTKYPASPNAATKRQEEKEK